MTPAGAVLLAVAVAALAPTAASAQQFRLLELPGVEALPRVPPLAPPQPPVTETPRLRGSVFARERVVVGMAPDGTPRTVTVSQRLLVRALGDYAFVVPAPAVRVVAGPGSQSRPGLRPNQIVWQGFSPRRKVLVAVAELRPGGSVPALPVRVRVTGRSRSARPVRARDLARERDADARDGIHRRRAEGRPRLGARRSSRGGGR